jgi:hypothetical protein
MGPGITSRKFSGGSLITKTVLSDFPPNAWHNSPSYFISTVPMHDVVPPKTGRLIERLYSMYLPIPAVIGLFYNI